ncbi:MAG: hypothetical protein RI996_337 [Candidatus Parcubacteria bacterium]|jgi:hypothetical protein
MSDIKPAASGGPSLGGIFTWFIVGFAVLYSIWYFGGGPQKESSNNAFIEPPTYQNPYTSKTYGTIEEIDVLNRQDAQPQQ